MASKKDLETWVKEALLELGGSGKLLSVTKIIWKKHQKDLIDSGDLFYTWQYDMRWAAKKLRDKNIMKPVKQSPPGLWELF